MIGARKKGITLIETLAAVGLFGIVIGSASGIFATSLVSQARFLQLKRIQEEARFLTEFLQKEARQAIKTRSGTCSLIFEGDVFYLVSSFELRFQNSRAECVGYRLSGSILERSTNDGLNWDNISSPDVSISNLSFLLVGSTNPTLDYSFIVSSKTQVRAGSVNLIVSSNVSSRAY